MIVNCLRPVKIKCEEAETGYIYVGCGRCPLCLQKKSNDWSFRLKAEQKFCMDSYFITLTYSNENLPKFGDNGSYEVTKAIKRFRKSFNLPENFKYFLISELGEKHGRLHYHALFFNTGMDWRDMLIALDRIWPFGRNKIADVIPERINYVSKYCLQNLDRPKPYYTNEEFVASNGAVFTARVKHKPVNFFFMRVSKGLGLALLTPQMLRYFRQSSDFVYYENGYRKAVPRYYLEKVFDDEDTLTVIKKMRLDYAIQATRELDDLRREYERSCRFSASIGERQPDEPEEILNLRGKAERILSKKKKCNYITPPVWKDHFNPNADNKHEFFKSKKQ